MQCGREDSAIHTTYRLDDFFVKLFLKKAGRGADDILGATLVRLFHSMAGRLIALR
jgi:hypothetical protein